MTGVFNSRREMLPPAQQRLWSMLAPAAKLGFVLYGGTAKDYRDIAALLRSGVDLATGLGGARVLYDRNFQPGEALKALVYFDDGDLQTLAQEDRAHLASAATAVGALPQVTLAAAAVD